MLIDITRCMGCRGCQVACKQWNDKPGESTEYSGTWTNPPQLSDKTWTLVDFRPAERVNGTTRWSFVRQLCMHCLHPACVSSCPVGALAKLDNGPVVYHAGKCMGCRYCMIACPFKIPKFEWDEALPIIQKCHFCFDRIDQGLEPACAQTCPTGAVKFGERDDLLLAAKNQIDDNPGKYVDHVYGEEEVGGTSVMFLSDAPFERMGFNMNLGTESLPDRTWETLRVIPIEAAAIVAAMAGVWWVIKRRDEAMKRKLDQVPEQ